MQGGSLHLTALARNVLVLGTNHRKMAVGCSEWLIMAIKAGHFIWRYYELIIVIILLKGIVINASKETKRAQITFLLLSPAIFNSLWNLLYLGTTWTKISAC